VAFEFRHLKEAGPGGCFAKVECQGRAGLGCCFSRCSRSGLCTGLGLLDLENVGLSRDRGLGRGSSLGWGRGLLSYWSLWGWLFRCGRCSLASRGRCWISLDLRHFRGLAFIYAGALVACASIFSSLGAAGGRAGVRSILLGSCVHVDIRSQWTLLSPRVHVDVGGRVVLLRRRVILRRGSGFVGRRRRCRRRRHGVTCRGYVGGGSGRRLFNVGAGT
jgi:hypothetical protein